QRYPPELVDLGARRELAGRRRHRPVADDLVAAAVVDVANLGELAVEAAAEAGLLLDLADRRLFERLALVELALREGPVVVLRAVDQGGLGTAVVGAPEDDGTRGANELAHAPEYLGS